MFQLRAVQIAAAVALLCDLGAVPAVWGTEPQADVDSIVFEQQIRPLLLKHCADCHGPGDQQSSLRLDARHAAFKGGDGGPVIVAGHSDQSELFRRISSEDPDLRMPPEGAGLSPQEVTLLQRWIDLGADWPETDYDREAAVDRRLRHWSFQPLGHVNPPDIEPRNTPAAPLTLIDRFLQKKLAESGLSPAPPADRRTLIRRLSFDLLGLPPTPEDIAAFENNPSPDAWEQLIERMLASPHHGERWAQHWLDIVRYADTHGFEVNTPREHAWRYRDYVIQALNEDRPYDQFILEQLAGDTLQADAATGFLVASAVLLPGQIGADDVSKRLARQDALDEIIVGTSGTLLGLTIGCARCHDHKFDPITAADYYAMQAFFTGVDYGDRQIRDDEWQHQQRQLRQLLPQIEELKSQLRQLEPPAFTGHTLIIDELDESRTTVLKTPNGPGINPPGTMRGYRDDPGTADRPGNLSQGRYTWWTNVADEDVFTWNPGVDGHFDLWISWGVHGSGVHTRDAQYVLDLDGDLTTRHDQQPLATADQYYPAGVSKGETEKQPLWSGLLHVGQHQLSKSSKIVLRGGQTGTGITADVIVLQQSIPPETDLSDSSTSASEPDAATKQPHLRAPLSFTHNVERFPPTPAKFVRFTTFATHNDNQYEPCLDELEIFSCSAPAHDASDLEQHVSQNVALAANGAIASSSGNLSESGRHQLSHIHDGRYGNDFSWISDQRIGGWVQIELPQTTWIDRIEWGRDRLGKFRDRLPVQFTISVSLNGQDWQTVTTHSDRLPLETPFDPVQALLRHARLNSTSVQTSVTTANDLTAISQQLQELQQLKAQLEQPRLVYGGVFREPDPAFLLRRGDPEQRLQPMDPAVPAVFTALRQTSAATSSGDLNSFAPGLTPELAESDLTDEQQRRLALATWIASPDNPLTARVMVNRIWQYHFGRGLVDTPSDFGLNGADPSHPELLDWLAAEFIRSGWSIRHMHRLMLQTVAYQQSHVITDHAAAVDGDNRLLWRFASRRLTAEVIRDSMLQLTGELNLKAGGPGFNFFQTRGGLDGFPPVEHFGADQMRRMIYAHKVRMEQVPIFGAFDCPDAGQAMPVRSQSTTAVQALNLFNSEFVNDRAVALAARLSSEAPDDQQQLQRAFLLVLGRPPSPTEDIASRQMALQHGLASVCRVLLNSNEFLVLP